MSDNRGLQSSPSHDRSIEVMRPDGDDFTAQFERFKLDRGIAFVLALAGGADDKNPALEALKASVRSDNALTAESKERIEMLAQDASRRQIEMHVRSILEPLQGYRIAVLTGGTAWGVPDVATRIAKQLGFPTIGVYPLAAKGKSALSSEFLDFSICVHPMLQESQWGDESPILVKLLDCVVIIGGGAGTMIEVAHMLKLNERSGNPTKWIIPITGTGGTADKLPFFPGKPETIARCIPSVPLTSGSAVLDFMFAKNIITDDICEPLDI